LPKDWEERTVPFSKEVAEILRKHPHVPNCPLVKFRAGRDLLAALVEKAVVEMIRCRVARERDVSPAVSGL
jgi:hypothetical protein